MSALILVVDDNAINLKLIRVTLEAAGHTPAQQPYFFVVIRNTTPPRNGELYTSFNFSNQPGVPWQSQGVGAAALLYTDWQIFDIAPSESTFQVGDTLEVETYAAGCEPGGHSGSVYVDGFGALLPSLAISKTAPAAANIDQDITYTFTVQNNTSGIAPNVVADEVLDVPCSAGSSPHHRRGVPPASRVVSAHPVRNSSCSNAARTDIARSSGHGRAAAGPSHHACACALRSSRS